MRSDASRWRWIVLTATAAVDALIIFDAFALAYLLRFRVQLLALDHHDPAPLGEYLKATVVVAYFWILLFHVFGLYDFTRHRSGIDIVHLVIKAVSFGTLLILSLTYFYREFSFSRLVCVYAWLISIALFSTFRVAIYLFRSDAYRAGHSLGRMLMVGSRTLARFLVAKTRAQPELGYEVVGMVDNRAPDTEVEGCPYLGTLDSLGKILDTESVDGVLIAHPTLGHFELLEVIQHCERRGLSIRMVPATYDLQVNYRDLEEVDGLPLVKINEQECRRLDDLSKRILDLVLAVPLLLGSLPLWLVIGLAIRQEDRGPIFFRQRRVGKDGRIFWMWKFRTMVVNADELLPSVVDVSRLAEPVFKLEDDPRVTRIGRLLRRSSLDELPQLWNVLLGEMSLVGPRPEEESIVRMYNVWERRRLKALPGITGLQQVTCRGCRSLRERVKWDILYLRKRSIFLDVWILLRTIGAVLGGRGAR